MLVRHESVEILQVVQPGRGPHAGGVPADIAEQLDAVLVRVDSPRFEFLPQLRNGCERRRRASNQLGGSHRRRVPVRHHGPVLLHAQGHRDGRMPARNTPGQGQVHVFLGGQNLPVVVTVAVIAEHGGKTGPQSQPGGGDGLIGDAPGAAAHPVAPDFRAGLRRVGQPGEDDVLEHGPGQEQVESVRGRAADGRERIKSPRRGRVHIRHITPYRRRGIPGESGAQTGGEQGGE
ncbi:hypothetical protein SRABI128_04618 [Microbacterium sp. Bi128]|nr:hypothetical protein SRABI128_04618 [Microbacterium sp. Bi128]